MVRVATNAAGDTVVGVMDYDGAGLKTRFGNYNPTMTGEPEEGGLDIEGDFAGGGRIFNDI